MAPGTVEKASAHGMPAGLAAYAVGRLGVLVDRPVDNVAAPAFFWQPEMMRAAVTEGRAAISPTEGARIYAQIYEEWGEEKLAGFAGTELLGELCAEMKVVEVFAEDCWPFHRRNTELTLSPDNTPSGSGPIPVIGIVRPPFHPRLSIG